MEIKTLTEQQFIEITEWQKKTFPNANSISKLAHLLEEIVECKNAIVSGNPEAIKEEYADCFLLLIGSGISKESVHY